MLVTEPSRRITLDEIRVHPWLKMKPMPALSVDAALGERAMDKAVLEDMVALGFDTETVQKAVASKEASAMTNLYYSILRARHGLPDPASGANEDDISVQDMNTTPRSQSSALPNIRDRPGTPSGDTKHHRSRQGSAASSRR